MTALKILVTSQKGGVGKSTVSANLAAYFCNQGKKTTLLDFDTHGSSSTWLQRAPSIGVVIQHHILPLDEGSNRPALAARLHLRRAAASCEVVISDLTWTDSIAGELMFEYDLVLVPTSVSEIELAATAGFLSRHHWVFDSTVHRPPTLLVCPTRVNPEQLENHAFSKQRFPVSFMLAPAILESQSARDMFERGYLMALNDACGQSFIEFAKAVSMAYQLHLQKHIKPVREIKKTQAPVKLASRHSVLLRHQLQRNTAIRSHHNTAVARESLYSQIPSLLKRWISK